MERHLDVPALQIHGSSATSSKSLQFLGGARNNLELARSTKHRDSSHTCQFVPFVREFIEVILLRPRQAQGWIPLGNRESHCDATCFGVVPDAVHLVDMAMKAEQFGSGPGAIAWILVCERAHWRDTFCFGCLSRQGSRVMFLRREKGHVLVQQAGRAVAHTSRASSHAFR